MSSWATFTSSFTSSSSLNFAPSSPAMPTSTYNAYHQIDCRGPLPQRRYPQAGDQVPYPQQNSTSNYDYQMLQKLVQLREAKLADCSYLTRQRKNERSSAQLKPGPPVTPTSGHGLQLDKITSQRGYNVTQAPAGPQKASSLTFQGEKPTERSTPEDFRGLTSSWSTHFVTGTLSGSQFGRNDCFSGFPVTDLSGYASDVSGYSSDESTTDSGSDALSFKTNFTWSFPISREERKGGVKHSAYSFDEDGKLRGLENSPVAIILTPPSEPEPKWRASPNDPACRPRRKDLLHPLWRAKH
ncbi:hypothetical protein FRC00_004201 [Tulasnella sp. 408]|nr:hypothetical protein FRC00_004201 [Tulasnella sp. 408]